MTTGGIKLVALDMDGTLTGRGKTLESANKSALDELARRYKLLVVDSGQCLHVFRRLGRFPADVAGNYGMQVCDYNADNDGLELVHNERVMCDKRSVNERVNRLRRRFGYSLYSGESVIYRLSGCFSVPLLGSEAEEEEKLDFDPDRERRRAIYVDVIKEFDEYNVIISGRTSFVMIPKPFDKRYALDCYCKRRGFRRMEVVYLGDDYSTGGSDECIYRSGYRFIPVDGYRNFKKAIAPLMT